MVDVSEKLCDLLSRAFRPVYEGKRKTTKDLADWLIENGVTVQEWISVEDELPKVEGLYLVAVKNDHNRRYSKTAWFYAAGGWFSRQSVTHWMELPVPPKEVQHG